MIKNYFKTAWRNLWKNKGYSFINIGGLAAGMATVMLIGLWIFDEFDFNRSFKNHETIAQVMLHETVNGERGTLQSVPMPLVGALKNNYGSSFKNLAMASWQDDHILSTTENKVTFSGNFMGQAIPEMLSLKMRSGNYTALKDPHSVILSEKAAQALFGNKDPVGKIIKIDNEHEVKVTGVYENIPFNTDFSGLFFIAPWDLYCNASPWVQDAFTQNQWDNNSFQLFAQIAPHSGMGEVNKKIKNVKADAVPEEGKKMQSEIFLHPMEKWHLWSNWQEGVQTGGMIEYVKLFGLIGIFILLLACINFMNLSTARSEKRAKEVGIRKAIGSGRIQLIQQFLSESFLVTALAFIIALIVTLLLLPWFNEITGKQILFPYKNGIFWIIALIFISTTGFLAGSYPALYLSAFKPVQVLKGAFIAGRFAGVPRKILVVLQFSVSVSLIIATIVVNKQVLHTKQRDRGYNSNSVIMVKMKSPDFYGKLDLLSNELKSSGSITEMACSSSPLNQTWNNTSGFNWLGKDPEKQADFATFRVTHGFGKTVGLQITQGRDFSRSISTDSAAMLLNEAAVKFMDLKNPVGTVVEYQGIHYTVIGVVKDMLVESPFEPVKQAVYLISYNRVNWFHIKLNPDKPYNASLASVAAVFKKFIPSSPFDYQFADDAFSEKFIAEERISRLTTLFTLLAIFISCLGLLGLASFVSEQRTKEIGIRKISGASVFSLWKLLSKDFFHLVLLSCIIAIPLAYYYLSSWLQNYQYRTKIGWEVFLTASLLALTITVLTVSFQALKAATANPVKSLRTE